MPGLQFFSPRQGKLHKYPITGSMMRWRPPAGVERITQLVIRCFISSNWRWTVMLRMPACHVLHQPEFRRSDRIIAIPFRWHISALVETTFCFITILRLHLQPALQTRRAGYTRQSRCGQFSGWATDISVGVDHDLDGWHSWYIRRAHSVKYLLMQSFESRTTSYQFLAPPVLLHMALLVRGKGNIVNDSHHSLSFLSLNFAASCICGNFSRLIWTTYPYLLHKSEECESILATIWSRKRSPLHTFYVISTVLHASYTWNPSYI